ncbi:MAG: hypothetical protein ABIK09_14955 [Pseudomonadota bacterium]
MRHRLLFGVPLICALVLAAVPAAQGGPNLTATVEMEVDYGPTEALVTFNIVFKNTGDEWCDATIWWADFWGAYTCQCDTNPMFCQTAPAASETWQFTDPEKMGPFSEEPVPPFVLSYPYSPEPYKFMLFVDSLFSCNEGGQEPDNFVCGEFIIDDTTLAAPDLEIVDCSVGQDPDFPAGVLFTAVVRNVGNSATDAVTYVDFFMPDDPTGQDVDVVWGNPQPADFFEVDAGLQPQQEVVVESTLNQCDVGWHYPIFTVNGLEDFPEPNWMNNWCIPAPSQYECSENVLLPDLILSEVGVDQEFLDLYGLIRIQGKIKNQGLLPITSEESFKLCIYEDWPQKPEACEVPEQGVNGWIQSFEDGLGPALETDFEKVSETASQGLHDYWFRVDCDCVDPEFGEILESDEKNNEAKLDDVLIPVEGPDLVVSEFQAAVLAIDGKNVIRYIVEVTNIGTEPITADIEVDLFRDHASDVAPDWDSVLAAIDAGETWPDNAEFFLIPGGLDANGEHALALFSDWVPEGDGTYTPWVVVDISNGILEANNENNAATIPGGVAYEALAPTQGPNLTIESFTGKVAGNRITFDLVVRNTGDEVAPGPFRIDLFRTWPSGAPNLGDWAEININVDELLPDATAPWIYEWEAVADGVYRSFALADTDNVVKETEEGDNMVGPLQFTVVTVKCTNGEAVQDGCLCGDEPQFTGYCCGDEWSAVGCGPVIVEDVEGDGDVGSGDDDGELITNFGSPSPDCGCRHAAPMSFPTGPALVLSLLALGLLALRRRSA